MAYHTMQTPEMQACIEVCLNCFKECEHCGEKCIGMAECAMAYEKFQAKRCQRCAACRRRVETCREMAGIG